MVTFVYFLAQNNTNINIYTYATYTVSLLIHNLIVIIFTSYNNYIEQSKSLKNIFPFCNNTMLQNVFFLFLTHLRLKNLLANVNRPRLLPDACIMSSDLKYVDHLKKLQLISFFDITVYQFCFTTSKYSNSIERCFVTMLCTMNIPLRFTYIHAATQTTARSFNF